MRFTHDVQRFDDQLKQNFPGHTVFAVKLDPSRMGSPIKQPRVFFLVACSPFPHMAHVRLPSPSSEHELSAICLLVLSALLGPRSASERVDKIVSGVRAVYGLVEGRRLSRFTLGSLLCDKSRVHGPDCSLLPLPPASPVLR